MITGRILSTCHRLSCTWKSTPKSKQLSGATSSRKMHIQPVPMFSDNYAYVLSDDKSGDAFVVDPANPRQVGPVLERLSQEGGLNVRGIITTHHHADHAGGNGATHSLLHRLAQDKGHKLFTGQGGNDYSVIGGNRCEAHTYTPAHGEVLSLPGGRISMTALHTPCHTQDSICYYVQDGDHRAVFTGDTLFIAGCGRFFEGKPKEMHTALNEVLAVLPDDTKVYPGHEYTASNVKFALSVSQSEPIRQLADFVAVHRQTPGISTIGKEKLYNVFMRVSDPALQHKLGTNDPVSTMSTLRTLKNRS